MKFEKVVELYNYLKTVLPEKNLSINKLVVNIHNVDQMEELVGALGGWSNLANLIIKNTIELHTPDIHDEVLRDYIFKNLTREVEGLGFEVERFMIEIDPNES